LLEHLKTKYNLVKKKPMQQTMTIDEKLAMSCKVAELRKAGDEEGASRLIMDSSHASVFGKNSQKKQL
jgi:hypothetical protein